MSHHTLVFFMLNQDKKYGKCVKYAVQFVLYLINSEKQKKI